MRAAAVKDDTHEIVVDEVFPHAPETLWKALTTGELIARWLMAPTGFAPIVGQRFTFQTTAGGAWNGIIHCQVLEATPNERLVYSWTGGHADNTGYGAPLDTVVTWSLRRVDEGTHVSLVHSGFVLPRNETALTGMTNGWKKVVRTLDTIAAEQASAKKPH